MEYNLRSDTAVYVRDPIRSAMLIPPRMAPPLTPAEKAEANRKYHKQVRKNILRRTAVLLGSMIFWCGLSALGGWLLVDKLGCYGISYLWGILCGLGMLWTVTIGWD